MKTATKERPVIFSGPMVKAILEGRKTQTRRVVKPQPHCFQQGEPVVYGGVPGSGTTKAIKCPYGEVGSRLWVRETWRETGRHMQADGSMPIIWNLEEVVYAADDKTDGPWRSPIHMPRIASRLSLEITDVRIERLNSISADDVRAEGVQWNEGPTRDGHTNHVSAFRSAWDKLNGKKHPWSSNPWVWAITFKPQPTPQSSSGRTETR